MKRLSYIIFLTLLFNGASLRASLVKLDVQGGLSRSFSFTDYKIGDTIKYPDGTNKTAVFPLSRLKFPLDLYYWNFEASGIIAAKVIIHAKVSGNMEREAGIMKDYDWNSTKDIVTYSTTDAFCSLSLSVDTDVSYRFISLQFFQLSGGIGFSYQTHGFTCDDLTQWDTSGGPLVISTYADDVITYRVRYYIPYLIIIPSINLWHIEFSLKVALSPYAVGMDRDDHLLRSKLSTGFAEGVAAWAALNVKWRIVEWLYLSAEFSAQGIFLTGSQEQERYATTVEGPPGPIGEIDQNIQSTQLHVSVGLGFSFEI